MKSNGLKITAEELLLVVQSALEETRTNLLACIELVPHIEPRTVRPTVAHLLGMSMSLGQMTQNLRQNVEECIKDPEGNERN